MTSRYKAGSRIQSVWEKYQGGGSQAAYDFGLTLGLAVSSLRAWTRAWDKEGGIAPPPKAAKDSTPQPVKMHTKQMIKVRYAKPGEDLAYLLRQGPQVSLVVFVHSGLEQNISNEWLGLPVEVTEVRPIRRYDF